MSRASDIDVDVDLFFDHDEDEGADLISSADVRVLHSSTRRFVLLPPKQKFNPKPIKAPKVKPAPRPRPARAPTLSELLPKATFPVCRPHYRLMRPKASRLPRVKEPTPYELRCAEPVARPRQFKATYYTPARIDYPLFKIGEAAEDVDAPMLSDLIDLCLSLLGRTSERTDGQHTPFAWLLNLRRAVRYYARKGWPKGVHQWSVPPKDCPAKPELAKAWAVIRQEITEAADTMEREMPLYTLSYRLNAYTTFMMVAIVGAARVLVGNPDGIAQYRLGVRMMPKDIEWWTNEHRRLQTLHRTYIIRNDLHILLRRVGVTEAQIAAASQARLLNQYGVRLVLLDPSSTVPDQAVAAPILPPEKIGSRPKGPNMKNRQ